MISSMKNDILKIFQKNILADKNCNVSANFQDIDPIFFLDSHLSSP